MLNLTHMPDGGWTWNPGAQKAFIREYEGTLLAALNIACAPDDFQSTVGARAALERIRSYFTKHPAASSFGEAMLLWASAHIEGLTNQPQRAAIVTKLLSLRSPDGGWSIENLIVGTKTFEPLQMDTKRPSDAYATGFVIHALRQSGFAADDARLRAAVQWLKTHQRASGRWFVPSLSGRPNHLLSNSATAWAVIALADCDEL